MYFLAAKASRYVKVVLSGEGADELFGGYNIYREPLALQKVAWIPEKIRRAVSRQARKLPDRRGKSFLIRAGQRVEERFIGNAHIFTDEERRELLKNPTDTPSCQELLRKTYEEAAGLSDPEKMQNIDLKYWLAGDILQKTDRMSMAHSLEVRVPFLDRDVFEAVRTLPPEAKFARMLDNYQPLSLNHANHGGDWKAHDVARSQVEKRNEISREGSEVMGRVIADIIEENVKKGNLRDA